jgi:hypothetical protein
MVFPFVDKANIMIKTFIANDVYGLTEMRFITMLEHLKGGYSTRRSRNAPSWTDVTITYFCIQVFV